MRSGDGGASKRSSETLIGRTRATDVLHRLRDDIIACALPPDHRLRFEALRASYGVSFSTLREALAYLVHERLVVAEGQRGFRVGPVTRADFLDVIEAHLLIESRLMVLALRHGDATWEASVGAALAALDAAREGIGAGYYDDPRWIALHRAYHGAINAACGSPTLLLLRDMIHWRWRRYRRIALLAAGGLPPTPDTHAALTEALRARDERRALALLEAQIRESAVIVIAHAGEALGP